MHPSCTCCGNTDLRQKSRMGDQHFVLQCCWEDWSMGSAVLSRDSGLCLGSLLQNAPTAADILVYDYALYPGGSTRSAHENVL